MTKTHWLSSPNKNYLGHWDLPENHDLVATVKTAGYENVKDPTTGRESMKKVIRFVEKDIKPLIVNQINSENIMLSTGAKYMQDSIGKRISLFVGETLDKRTKTMVDCVRVRKVQPPKEQLTPEHKLWSAIQKAILDGSRTIEQMKQKFEISKEHETQLTTVQD